MEWWCDLDFWNSYLLDDRNAELYRRLGTKSKAVGGGVAFWGIRMLSFCLICRMLASVWDVVVVCLLLRQILALIWHREGLIVHELFSNSEVLSLRDLYLGIVLMVLRGVSHRVVGESEC